MTHAFEEEVASRFTMGNFMKEKSFGKDHTKYFNRIDHAVEGDLVKVEMSNKSIFVHPVTSVFTQPETKKVNVLEEL